MADTQVSLKLLIHKNSQRVLYAEASKKFVDFLFNIFTLPLGEVIRLLKDEGMVGCLPRLYNSIEKLSDAYILSDQHKDFLLKPKVAIPGAQVPLLLPGDGSLKGTRSSYNFCFSCSRQFFREKVYCEAGSCTYCRNEINRLPSFKNPPSSSEEGYVEGMVTYLVLDDLEVKPMFITSFVTLLNEMNVKEVGSIEERVVDLGMHEGVKLLKASLQSKTVLTDVFLRDH
ncbi:hypothetical protein CJ030_MR3G014629 [Morella rubra]|uniref:DUF674 domain-containing protein n=1 Tax=Morella rubra TaxID=262757 RepID=A0A6A1VYE4_9ROSI|nr:hypothetical protein CJ030_MR3G014629 [Morella rubra]